MFGIYEEYKRFFRYQNTDNIWINHYMLNFKIKIGIGTHILNFMYAYIIPDIIFTKSNLDTSAQLKFNATGGVKFNIFNKSELEIRNIPIIEYRDSNSTINSYKINIIFTQKF